MRQLKTKTIISITTLEFEDLIQLAVAKQLSDVEETHLLTQLRNGNAECINLLIDSSEIVILKTIKQYAPPDSDYIKLIRLSNETLRKLAEHEINSKNRERFLRFRAWWVRQAILGYLNEKT